MGWSCTIEANRTLKKWESACRAETLLSNVWGPEGSESFFELGAEQEDGAIVGDIFKSFGVNRCRRVSGFRIEPDGTVTEAPEFLRKAAA